MNRPQTHRPSKQDPQLEQIPWSTVLSFLEKNPFQEKTLEPFCKQNAHVEPEPEPVHEWHIQPVEPVGPLSCVLFLNDAEYASLSTTARAGELRKACTDLQERAEKHLRGRAWPVKKTAEGIVAAAFEPLPKEWSKLGLSAICELNSVQMIFFNPETKEMNFIPEDARNWKYDRPCIMIQHDARAVWVAPDDFTNQKLAQWLEMKEAEGWKIAWPETDGTVTELKALAEQLNVKLLEGFRKIVHQRQIGRAQTMKLFLGWTTME